LSTRERVKKINLGAVATGEKRAPRKGEWYLSGAIVGAYKAPNDLDTVFQIARVIRTKTIPARVVPA
jgi:hypothetical protein